MNFNNLITRLSDWTVIDIVYLRYILSVVFLIIGLAFRQIFAKGIIRILLHFAKKTKTTLDEMVVYAIERPARTLIVGLSIWAALSTVHWSFITQKFLNLTFRSLFILALFWFLYGATETLMWVFDRFLNKNDKKVDIVLIRFLRKSIKILIVVLGVFMIIKEWGYDVSGLIAGLGVGGLAFALAAKDAVSNLLGSITIMLDKPFGLGDWIETEETEGIVEGIGFRSTKIRTFAQALISVPNSIMSNEPITNWSRMGKRQVNYTLQIPLDTPPEKIESLLFRIRDLLKNHADVHQDMIAVNLKSIKDATLEIIIYYFTKTTSWVTYLAVTQEVNINVLRIFRETGIPIILPVKRLVMEGEPSDHQNSEVRSS